MLPLSNVALAATPDAAPELCAHRSASDGYPGSQEGGCGTPFSLNAWLKATRCPSASVSTSTPARDPVCERHVVYSVLGAQLVPSHAPSQSKRSASGWSTFLSARVTSAPRRRVREPPWRQRHCVRLHQPLLDAGKVCDKALGDLPRCNVAKLAGTLLLPCAVTVLHTAGRLCSGIVAKRCFNPAVAQI